MQQSSRHHGFTSSDKDQLTTLNRLYTRKGGKAAFGSVANLVKASGISKDVVEKFLASKETFTQFHQAKRKFKRMTATARFINDIWCIDLAYMDKLAAENKGVMYLFVAVDLFSRYVRVQPMKSKTAKEAKKALSNMKTYPKKIWVDQGTEFAGVFKQYCKALGIHVYHTFSDTKAAYAERAIQSLKNVIYRYMEDSGTYRYIDHLQSFVGTLNSRVNRSTGIPPNKIKNTDFLRVLYNKPQATKKPSKKFSLGDLVRISKVDLPFRKGYKPQFTKEIFKICKYATVKPIVTYMLEDMSGEVIKGKFYESELMKIVVQ